MVKKDKRKDAKGRTRTQIRVVEGYCVGAEMPTKQRTIKDFGCLEDQVDQDAFMEMVQKFNETYKKENIPLRFEASTTAKMYGIENRRYNYGVTWIYTFLVTIQSRERSPDYDSQTSL